MATVYKVELEPALIKEFNREMSLMNDIIRFLLSKLDK